MKCSGLKPVSQEEVFQQIGLACTEHKDCTWKMLSVNTSDRNDGSGAEPRPPSSHIFNIQRKALNRGKAFPSGNIETSYFADGRCTCRHEICQKLNTTRFLGRQFHTLKRVNCGYFQSQHNSVNAENSFILLQLI